VDGGAASRRGKQRLPDERLRLHGNLSTRVRDGSLWFRDATGRSDCDRPRARYWKEAARRTSRDSRRRNSASFRSWMPCVIRVGRRRRKASGRRDGAGDGPAGAWAERSRGAEALSGATARRGHVFRPELGMLFVQDATGGIFMNAFAERGSVSCGARHRSGRRHRRRRFCPHRHAVPRAAASELERLAEARVLLPRRSVHGKTGWRMGGSERSGALGGGDQRAHDFADRQRGPRNAGHDPEQLGGGGWLDRQQGADTRRVRRDLQYPQAIDRDQPVRAESGVRGGDGARDRRIRSACR